MSHEYNDLYKNEFPEVGCQVRFQPRFGKLLVVANQNVITILEYLSLVVNNSL